MAFNVQLMPWKVAVLGERRSPDARERAGRVAASILALPPARQPHVIAFNEVFDEGAREVLIDQLGALWPYRAEKIDDADVTTQDDSGLMLISQLPLRDLSGPPEHDTVLERFFGTVWKNVDGLAAKGFGIVQVDSPDEGAEVPVTIAFTHMQASYDSPVEYAEVRAQQLDLIWAGLKALLDRDGRFEEHLERAFLIGDINISGDSQAEGDEWEDIFRDQGTALTRSMHDVWRGAMHPPGDTTDYDKGYTNVDLETGVQQRLDYIVAGQERRQFVPTSVVPHHIRISQRNASDHFAVEAVLQRRSHHCQPSDAIRYDKVRDNDGQGLPTSLTPIRVTFDLPGAYQWIYVPDPGTFSLWASADTRYEVYLRSDLSTPLEHQGEVNASDLDGTAEGDVLAQNSFDIPVAIEPVGRTFAPHEPFFIAATTNHSRTGSRAVFVLEHNGATRQTAILLNPHRPLTLPFPETTVLGSNDTCWLRATIPSTYAGTQYVESFVLTTENVDQKTTFALLDSNTIQLNSDRSADSKRSLGVLVPGHHHVFLTVRRSAVNPGTYQVTWPSPVSYLMLDAPLGLFVNEETGLTGAGADDIDLKLDLDGVRIFEGRWDDADTGERWPGLYEAVAATLRQANRGPFIYWRAGFVNDLAVTFKEVDFSSSGAKTRRVLPITAQEGDVERRRVALQDVDIAGDGLYTFYCSLSRYR
ncbi:endonuclease/exonuclease/phosphatase family protein [Kineosporia babensis]|uniref:Endonuclease/exonuclease/phosphatase domain-containing protein n=1 Tax=Kineosporia babensis TaxID=499548 RepID=A0A9X1SXN1_9ACTN|nr:hypothetical protein [Kineosporia babensis]MCD5316106.1 hypothetical protein [Kineosporia babensis]